MYNAVAILDKKSTKKTMLTKKQLQELKLTNPRFQSTIIHSGLTRAVVTLSPAGVLRSLHHILLPAEENEDAAQGAEGEARSRGAYPTWVFQS